MTVEEDGDLSEADDDMAGGELFTEWIPDSGDEHEYTDAQQENTSHYPMT